MAALTYVAGLLPVAVVEDMLEGNPTRVGTTAGRPFIGRLALFMGGFGEP